ncbi:MAG TPA: DNA polymerase III subunit delta [Nitrospirales bacterium]|jgi:DNA polymerase-3 subunit delta
MSAKREGIGISELIRQLGSGPPAPIYLLLGEETFLREAALVAIRRSVLGDEKEDNGFNCDLLYGDETDALEVLNRCDTLPAFAARRLVIIRNAGALRPRETERLMPYLKAPVETTCLVLASEKVDGRLKFFQTLKAVAMTVDCFPLDARFMPEWIHEQAKSLGLGLDDAAYEALHYASGGNLAVVRRELEKLVDYLHPNTRVSAADVEAVRGADCGGTVWDFLEALARKDRAASLRTLGQILDAGEPPLRLIGLLAFQWRQVWKTREKLDRRVPEAGLARSLGVPPFRVRGLVEQARGLSNEELSVCFEAFREADFRLKGGERGTERRIMERLVLNLCRGARRATSARAFVPAR